MCCTTDAQFSKCAEKTAGSQSGRECVGVQITIRKLCASAKQTRQALATNESLKRQPRAVGASSLLYLERLPLGEDWEQAMLQHVQQGGAAKHTAHGQCIDSALSSGTHVCACCCNLLLMNQAIPVFKPGLNVEHDVWVPHAGCIASPHVLHM